MVHAEARAETNQEEWVWSWAPPCGLILQQGSLAFPKAWPLQALCHTEPRGYSLRCLWGILLWGRHFKINPKHYSGDNPGSQEGHVLVPICLGAYLKLSNVTLTQHTCMWKIMIYSHSHLEKNKFCSWRICHCLKLIWIVTQMFQQGNVTWPQGDAQLCCIFHHGDAFLKLLMRFSISLSSFNGHSSCLGNSPFVYALCPFID